MGLYDRHLLPRLVDCACRQGPMMRQREKVVPLAVGRVLEVGIGTGLNLAYYDRHNVEIVWGLEPSGEMLARARRLARGARFPVEFIERSAEEIPLERDAADTVVMTYTLCTIADTGAALREVARVLRPGGRLLFSEHGAAPEPSVRRWQDRIDPIWKRLAGGCHLNREIPRLLEAAGFTIGWIDTMYLPGWKPGSFNYWGSAHR